MITAVLITAASAYEVRAGDTLIQIARKLGVSVSDLVEVNHIEDPDVIHIGQQLLLPGEGNKTHVVKPGESLGRIAIQYGVSVASLIQANSLSDPDFLKIGQKLTLKASASTPAPTPQYHLVQRGETLAGISRKYGISVKTLMDANGITDPTRLYYGTRLRLSGTAFVAAPSATTASYTVVRGDSLDRIARKYGVTASRLAEINSVSHPNLIFVGQKLKVPSSGWVCPLPAARYINDWGFPRPGGRFHEGNDLFSPRGTDVRAPVSGVVEYLTGSIGGLQFKLVGDDGNNYYGSHLSASGKEGRVAAGDVIGKVGNSGNAASTSPHLHFEIHPNRGAAVNPYPTLQRHGC
jgi:LysM repeat protein